MLRRIAQRGRTSASAADSSVQLLASKDGPLSRGRIARAALHWSTVPHKRFDRNASRGRSKAKPAWKSRENELRLSLNQLEEKLDHLDKQQQAASAAKHLPELDEEALQEIYQGVKEGDPIPSSDLKLLEAQERKSSERLSRVLQRTRKQFPFLTPQSASGENRSQELVPPLIFAERVQQRLGALSYRLAMAEQQLQIQSQSSSSSAGEVIGQLRRETGNIRARTLMMGQQTGVDKDTKQVRSIQERELEYKGFETVSLNSESCEKGLARAEPDLLGHKKQANSFTATGSETTSSEQVVDQLTRLLQDAKQSQSERSSILRAVKTGEWVALGTQLVQRGNDELLGKTFTMIEGLIANEMVEVTKFIPFYEAVADSFAGNGRSSRCETLVVKMADIGLQPTSYVYHALTKSYLRDATKGISTALQLINHLENSPSPASEATYSLVLSTLLDQPSMEVQDQAWGVWYRMRLNAHPVPDAVTWSKMFRACALGSTPSRDTQLTLLETDRGQRRGSTGAAALPGKSERAAEAEVAMDLFREMTTVHCVRPTPACYDNLILTLCRSPRGRYLEGFNLLREMIALAAESKVSSYEPTRATFNALLEGCRRHADLLRTRWILAEMIRSSAPLWGSNSTALKWKDVVKLEARMPDAESLGKLFLTYAAWSPPKMQINRKNPVSLLFRNAGPDSDNLQSQSKKNVETSSMTEAIASNKPSDSGRSLTQPDMDEAAAEFSSTPPATSTEVVRELRGLLARAIADQTPAAAASRPVGPFSRVEISTRLLNAYLAALMAHLPKQKKLEALISALRGAESLFAKLRIEPNGRTLLQVLRTCYAEATAQRSAKEAVGFEGSGSIKVDELAHWAWSRWRILEASADRQMGGFRDQNLGTDRRTREYVWGERIRLLAKQGMLDEAMDTLKKFVSLYPPMPVSESPLSHSSLDPVERKMPFFDASAAIESLVKVEQAGGTKIYAARAKPSAPSNQWNIPEHKKDTSIAEVMSEAASSQPTEDKVSSDSRKIAAVWLDDMGNPSSRPPSLSFYELNTLHQRLVEAGGRWADVAYISWVCKTWESMESKKQARRRQRQSESGTGLKGSEGESNLQGKAQEPSELKFRHSLLHTEAEPSGNEGLRSQAVA